MIRIALTLALALAVPASAETVAVRSGEHDTFSRLVFQLDRPTPWTLRRTDGGYRLAFDRADVAFDTGGVFRLIPRTRIVEVAPGAAGTLAVSVADDTHADAFELRPGLVVLDIKSGAAPAGSPFEQRVGAAAPVPAPTPRPRPSVAQMPPIRIVPAERPLGGLDPLTDFYWRKTMQREVPVPRPAEETRAAGQVAARATEPSVAQAAEGVGNARVREAEQALLMQLSRAASQGIVTLERRPDRMFVNDEDVETEAEAAAAPSDADPPPEQAQAVHAETGLPLRAVTVFDRDAGFSTVAEALNNITQGCYPDQAFNLSGWLEDRPFDQQLGDRQRALVGEFDRPDPDQILGLQRLYLSVGFGTEARAVREAFGLETAEDDAFKAMEAIFEGKPVPPGNRVREMASCDTAAAMWAVLANEDLGRDSTVETAAVLRSFSALPLPIRRILGPDLARRMIEVEHPKAASEIRDAIARAPGDHGAALDMVEARISIAEGEPLEAEKSLAPILSEDGPAAPEATVLMIETMVGEGRAPDEATVEYVAALAFEHRKSEDGPELARALALATAATGQMGRAFDTLETIPRKAEEMRAKTRRDLFGLLAEVPDDRVFLEQALLHQSQYADTRVDWPVHQALVTRMLDLGLPELARSYADTVRPRSEAARFLQARVELENRAPDRALNQLLGLTGEDAARMRAEAFAMKGDHLAARAAFSAAGDQREAALQGWRSGDWSALEDIASDDQLVALTPSGNVSPPVADSPLTPLPGPITQGRDLLAQSEATRAALQSLISDFPAE